MSAETQFEALVVVGMIEKRQVQAVTRDEAIKKLKQDPEVVIVLKCHWKDYED